MPFPFQFSSRFCTVLLGFCLVAARPAQALMYYDTASTTYNTSAPTGILADSGWQYEGYFGLGLGTMISPNLFITAGHTGVLSSTFTYASLFSGAPDVTYSINTSANGGVGYWNIAGTDLRIYQITGGTFPTYAPIYSGNADLTSDFVVTGRGAPKGAAVTLGGNTQGWLQATGDSVARWGTNTFTGAVNIGSGPMLVAEFDAITGQSEAFLTSGDSGGADFINVGGVWYLAGINYGIEAGPYDTDLNHTNGNEIPQAALFDRGGFYEYDGVSWVLNVDTVADQPAAMVMSRVSSSAPAIQNIIAITQVPEPGSALLVLTGGMAMMMWRRRPRRVLASS